MAEEGIPPEARPPSLPRGDEDGLAKELQVWRGTGIADLRSCLDPGKTHFGLIRFTLGSGVFKRQKYCFVHIVGDSVPIVKRGRQNARKEEIMAEFGGSHTDISFSGDADVTTEQILAHMMSTIATDDGSDGQLDVAAARKQMEEQMAAAPEPEPGPETEPEPESQPEPEPEAEPISSTPPPQYDFKEVIEEVRSETGRFNWLLAAPDAAAPKIVCAGSGSIPEVREALAQQEKQVLFGLVRAGFGSGAMRRNKWLFVHWTGPNVSMVKRGGWNSQKAAMQELCRPYSLDCTLNNLEEAAVETIVDDIKQSIVHDGGADGGESIFSVSAFLAAVKEEQEAAAAAAAAAAAEAEKLQAEKAAKKAAAQAKAKAEAEAAAAAATPVSAVAVAPYIPFGPSVTGLRTEGEDASKYNWLLVSLNS